MTNPPRYRVLLIDDTASIHEDIKAVLRPGGSALAQAASRAVDDMEQMMFGDDAAPASAAPTFDTDSAFQGQQGHRMVCDALARAEPYALAIVDMRMPPGWNGLETIVKLWEVDDELQVVICTAFSDHDWSEITERLGYSERLLVIKKPFDGIEILQATHALCKKWQLQREVAQKLISLDGLVASRTAELNEANMELQRRLTSLQRMELDLRLAQKLEGIGRLASGVAHEINTPVQFIADNLDFLRESFGEVRREVDRVAALVTDQDLPALRNAELEYLDTEVPLAITSLNEGVTRIAKIVGAMKSFTHNSHGEYADYSVNHGIETTLEIARGEYRDIAELTLQLGQLPNLHCQGDELNQALLNLIVNASHAIQDVVGSSGQRGMITVSTRAEPDSIVISVKDTGTGISEAVKTKMFDLFFTTKEVGRGTGQGLSLVWRVVVDNHGGQVWVDTELGVGSTFHLRLPLHAQKQKVAS